MRISNDKKNVGEPRLIVNKNIIKWKDSTIQIKNISSLSIARVKPKIFSTLIFLVISFGCVYMLSGKIERATKYSNYYIRYSGVEDKSLVERIIETMGIGGIIGMLVLIGIAIGCFVAFCLCLKNYLDCRYYRYLCIEMNSGNTVLFLFKSQDFLGKVLLILNDLIENPSASKNIQINIKDNVIRDNGKILSDAKL